MFETGSGCDSSPSPLPAPVPSIWSFIMDTKMARIRALNDQLRRHLADGIQP